MNVKMSKGRSILFVMALFLTNIAAMVDMVIIPAIPKFYEVFEGQMNLVNYIVSGPALIMVFSALICGRLMSFFSKKTLIVFGFGLLSVASIGGLIIESASYVATMRTFIGVAMGIVTTAAIALLAEVYTEEKQRSTMMGWFNSAMAVIGVALGLVAGLFAAQAWQSVFIVYWVTVPALIMMILFLPKTAPEAVPDQHDNHGMTEKINWLHFGAMLLAAFVINAVYCALYYQIGIYVAETSIGNEAFVGMLSSLGAAGSAIACALFGLIYNKFQRGTIIFGFAFITFSYAGLYLMPGVPIAITASILMGAAYGISFSFYMMRSTIIVPPSKVSGAISMTNAAIGTGMFASTYCVTIVKSLFNVETFTAAMPTFAAVAALGTILSICFTIKEHKLSAKFASQEN